MTDLLFLDGTKAGQLGRAQSPGLGRLVLSDNHNLGSSLSWKTERIWHAFINYLEHNSKSRS